MRVEKLPEAVEQLSTLQTATLRVDEDEQGADVDAQVFHLCNHGDNHQAETTMCSSIALPPSVMEKGPLS